jgi:sRNA-binding regulator protein Hfq
MLNILFTGEKLKGAMTSVANYLVDPDNTVLEKDEKIAVYEHAGLHMVFRKIIGHDQILEKNNESKTNFIS